MEVQEMIEKANDCLNCKTKPCSQKGCPLGNQIPDFIQAVKKQEIQKAYEILCETTVLPGICGRICPHQKQCQGSCIRGIKGNPVSIGEIEAYIFDQTREKKISFKQAFLKEEKKELQDKKVAVIGGGPAGLTCSAFLAKKGVSVTIYEKYDYLGGLLVHGIPEFRLPKEVVKQTVDQILTLGIQVKYQKELGKNITLPELKKKYDAIFLSFGANQSSKMGVKGEELLGVYGGNELLEHNLHPDYTNKTVSVIGGGNVAMDCARTILRKGAKQVNVIYRRAEKQMPAEQKEIEEAKKEGVQFLFQNNIVEIIGTDQVEKLELIKTKLVKKQGKDREVPVNIENSNYKIPTDYVIMALGGMVSETVFDLGITLNKWGNLYIDQNYQTSDPMVFAGGDLAGIKGTVAWAANSGKQAAKSIIQKLKKCT